MNDEIKERITMINRGEVPEGYKSTKIGIIPKDWNVKTLGELGEFKNGLNKSKEDFGSGQEMVNLNDVFENVSLNLSDTFSTLVKCNQKEIKEYSLKKGDVLFVRSSVKPEGVGLTTLIEKDLIDKVYGGFLIRFRDNSQELTLYFKKYCFDATYFRNRLLNYSTVSANTNINQKSLERLELILPSVPEQNKIASILLAWDKAIELKEQLVEEKKKQKKGLMQRLLTGEVRLPGFDGEWEEVRLGEVVKRIKGKAIKYSKNGIYPAIDMDYLETGVYKNYSNDDTVLANEKDVLLLWDGSRAGKAFTGVNGIVGSTFVKLECKNINHIFLQKNLEFNEERIQRIREGSGIPHIPKDFFSYYKIRIPIKEEQKAIAQILSTADKEIELLEEELEQLQLQKKGLMQLLLTGIIRVKP